MRPTSIGKSFIRGLVQLLSKLGLIILVLHLQGQVLTRISNLNLCHLTHLEQARDMMDLDLEIQTLEKRIHLIILGRKALGVGEDQYQLLWAQNHNTRLRCKTAFITKAGR